MNANTALVRVNDITSPTFNALAQNLSPRIARVGWWWGSNVIRTLTTEQEPGHF